jgi:hypothetical protein
MKVTTIGIGLAKSVFSIHGVDQHGKCGSSSKCASPTNAMVMLSHFITVVSTDFGAAKVRRSFSCIGLGWRVHVPEPRSGCPSTGYARQRAGED